MLVAILGRFRLLNMRQPMRFLLLRDGFEYPTLAAFSAEILVDNPNEPTGGHLALTGKQGCGNLRRVQPVRNPAA